MSMMLLGKCPRCGREDTICQETGNPADLYKARCSACLASWNNWPVLMREESGRKNKLIPIQIERLRSSDGQEWGIRLAWLSNDEIPFYDLIVRVFNTALVARYGFRSSLHPSGGVEGYHKGSYIELLSDSCLLGLYVVNNKPPGKEVRKILDFYHLMLHYLFESGSLGMGQYRRGEILRLPQNQSGNERAWGILRTMLSTARSQNFAREVENMITEINATYGTCLSFPPPKKQ